MTPLSEALLAVQVVRGHICTKLRDPAATIEPTMVFLAEEAIATAQRCLSAPDLCSETQADILGFIHDLHVIIGDLQLRAPA